MDSKPLNWFILVISTILFFVFLFRLIVDIGFFATREETDAKVISIEKPWNYKIKLKYYHNHKEFYATVDLKSSYKDQIEKFSEIVTIYYNKWFPHNVYIKDCRVPLMGIIIVDLLLVGMMILGFLAGYDKIKRKTE